MSSYWRDDIPGQLTHVHIGTSVKIFSLFFSKKKKTSFSSFLHFSSFQESLLNFQGERENCLSLHLQKKIVTYESETLPNTTDMPFDVALKKKVGKIRLHRLSHM